ARGARPGVPGVPASIPGVGRPSELAPQRRGGLRVPVLVVPVGDPVLALELRSARPAAHASAAVPVHAAVRRSSRSQEGAPGRSAGAGPRSGVSIVASPRATAVSWAKKGVKLALLAPAAWGRVREPGLFVLIYHRVGAGQGREMDLP